MDDPSPALRTLFDEAWYRNTYGEGFDHYVTEGAAAGLSPGPHFDETWYRHAHPAVARAVAERKYPSGYHHYAYEGASQGLAPNRYFMPRWYVAWYRDAREAVESGEYANAFEHYLREGIELQLSPNPFFEERWYRQTYQDVDEAVRDGRFESGHRHYIERGAEEGRQGSTIFDPAWYVARYPQVRHDIESGLARHAYDHFCRYGLAAAKSSCADFDEQWYRREYPDVAEGVANGRWINGLHHFVAEGMMHGYAPAPAAARADALGYSAAASPIARRELREFLRGHDKIDLGSSDSPVVSIVLVLHNRAAFTLRSLRSIAAWAGVPHEVIAVDNDSRDETSHVLARVRGLRVEKNERNLHFLRACNQAAAVAAGRYLLFLNNDCELQVGALRAAVAILESQPDAGAVGAKVILHDGRLQEAGCYLRPNAFSAQFGRGQDPFASEFMHRRDVPYCSGSFLMTPRALFAEMGGFDETFCPIYYEDVDYCLRLWRRGRRVIYDPECIIEHGDAGALYQRFIYPMVLRNMATLHRRYCEYFASVPDYGIAPVSSRDGLAWRSASLWIVNEVTGNPEWASALRSAARDKRFITIYPLRAWQGERQDLPWLPPEVELVSGRGSERLEEFCRARAQVYDDLVMLSPVPLLRQWLPNARLLEHGLGVANQSQI